MIQVGRLLASMLKVFFDFLVRFFRNDVKLCLPCPLCIDLLPRCKGYTFQKLLSYQIQLLLHRIVNQQLLILISVNLILIKTFSKQVQSPMNITAPYVKVQLTSGQLQQKNRYIQLLQSKKARFQDYCKFSFLMLNQSAEQILQHQAILIQPKIDFYPAEKERERTPLKKMQRQEVRNQGKKLEGMMKQSWNYIIKMIKEKDNGKGQKLNDELDIQKDLDQESARLFENIRSLEKKKFRFENTHELILEEQVKMQREIQQEITFIKLLHGVLQKQISTVKQFVKNNGDIEPFIKNKAPPKNQQKIKNIEHIIKFDKIYDFSPDKNDKEDEITRIEKRRIENLMVMRYSSIHD